MHDSEEEERKKETERRKVRQVKRKTNQTEIFMLNFSTLLKVSGTYRVDLAIE